MTDKVYNTIITNTTFKENYRISIVDLNNRPVKDNTMESGFSNSSSLNKVGSMNDSVENLDNTYANCYFLTNVSSIPSNCKSMNGTFQNCTSLNSLIDIPQSVLTMDDCFNGCIRLAKSPNIGQDKNIISMKRAFKNTALNTSPIIPDTVEDMEEVYSDNNALVTISNFPNNVKSLKKCCSNCKNLSNVPEIPASVENIEKCFLNCNRLGDTISIRSEKITNAIDCFLIETDTPQDKNVYIPFSDINEIDTQTYISFKQAGYSSQKRKDGVLLAPLGTHIVTFIINTDEEAPNVQNTVVKVTYNDTTYTCINTLSTHENGTCPNGCAKNKFFLPIPDNVEFTYTVKLDGFLKFSGTSLTTNEEYNIEVYLNKAEESGEESEIIIVDGSDTYEANMVLLGVVRGLPQPTEEDLVTSSIIILDEITNIEVSNDNDGSDTYEADLVLLGVVKGLPQPDEETLVMQTITVLDAI